MERPNVFSDVVFLVPFSLPAHAQTTLLRSNKPLGLSLGQYQVYINQAINPLIGPINESCRLKGLWTCCMGLGFPWIVELHIWETEWLWINSSSGADSRDGAAPGNGHAQLLNVGFATKSLHNLQNLCQTVSRGNLSQSQDCRYLPDGKTLDFRDRYTPALPLVQLVLPSSYLRLQILSSFI